MVEVAGSNSGWVTGYRCWNYSWFSSVCSGECGDPPSTSKSVPNRDIRVQSPFHTVPKFQTSATETALLNNISIVLVQEGKNCEDVPCIGSRQ